VRNSDKEVMDSTKHVYDTNGRLVQLTRSDGISPGYPINFVYDSNGRISEIVVSSNMVLEKREYNSSGQLAKIIQYAVPDDPDFKTLEQTLVYDAFGKLISMYTIFYDRHFGNPPFPSINKYTYNAAGLIAIDSTFWGKEITGSGKDEFTQRAEFEYDTKKGINEFGLRPDWGQFEYWYKLAPLKHNITSIKVNGPMSVAKEMKYQYEYNANDYPSKIFTYSGNTITSTRKITYRVF
jgi:hypothetical protein